MESLNPIKNLDSELLFFKYEANGNDFVCIDDRMFCFPAENVSLIRHLCDRRYGIGADGLILLQEKNFKFFMQYFNADGCLADLCGNGLRATLQFIQDLGLPLKEKGELDSACASHCFQIKNGQISVSLGKPKVIEYQVVLSLKAGIQLIYDHLLVGVDHVVITSPFEFERFSPEIRHHPKFSPIGVNVNFAIIEGRNHILLRTFEKGVEAETESCGTGGAATFYALWQKGWIDPQCKISYPRQQLTYQIQNQEVYVSGNVHFVFVGNYPLRNYLREEEKLCSLESQKR